MQDVEGSHKPNASTISVAGMVGVRGQGPFMLITLKIQERVVREARFLTYGCPAAEACGTFATEWVEGKPVDEAANLSEQMILDGVGHMPLGREHCPGLAVGAPRDAISRLET